MKNNVRADVFIAAMGRSGSTMLANKLTSYEGSVVFIEPSLVVGGNRALIRGFRSVGKDFKERPDLRYLNRIYEIKNDSYKKEFLRWLNGVDYWGFKEVEGAYFQKSVEMFNPRKIVILVRDVKQVFYSFYEKSLKQDRLVDWNVEWIVNKIKKTAECQMQLQEKYPGRSMVVNYEDISREEYLKNFLFKKLGYSFPVGDAGAGFEDFNRSWEVNRNIDREKSDLSPCERGIPSELEGVADKLEEDLKGYVEKMVRRKSS